MKRVLVTGGAGYIGSHLVDALVRQGNEVTVFDSLVRQVHRSGNWPPYINLGARYVQGDVRDREALASLVVEAEIVVHFAAAVSVGQSMYQVDRYVDVNTHGTGVLLDILVNEKNKVEKLLVASSVGVYGEGAYECLSCGSVAPPLRSASQLAAKDWELNCPVCNRKLQPKPTSEEKPFQCENIYAQTKRHQEEMCLLIGKTYGIPTVAVRFFNVFGPRQSLSNPYAGVAAIFLSRLLNGNPPIIFEDGGQLRDFVSVHDVVDGLILLIEKSGADYLPVNLGSGNSVSILQVAETLIKLLGSPLRPQITQKARKVDVRHCFADISRACQTVGFDPKVLFEDGMREFVEWARHQPDTIDLFDRAYSELQGRGLA